MAEGIDVGVADGIGVTLGVVVGVTDGVGVTLGVGVGVGGDQNSSIVLSGLVFHGPGTPSTIDRKYPPVSGRSCK